jgi:hypothetical protein
VAKSGGCQAVSLLATSDLTRRICDTDGGWVIFKGSILQNSISAVKFFWTNFRRSIADIVLSKITDKNLTLFSSKNYHPISWRDSISRPIAQISSVAGGDITTRPRRQGQLTLFIHKFWPKRFHKIGPRRSRSTATGNRRPGSRCFRWRNPPS